MSTQQYHPVAITQNAATARRVLNVLAAGLFLMSLWLIVSPISNTFAAFSAVTFVSIALVGTYRWVASRKDTAGTLSERISDFVTSKDKNPKMEPVVFVIALVILSLPSALRGTWVSVLVAVMGILVAVGVLHFNPWNTVFGSKIKRESVMDFQRKIGEKTHCAVSYEACLRILNEAQINGVDGDEVTVNIRGAMKDTGQETIVNVQARTVGEPVFSANNPTAVVRDGSIIVRFDATTTPWGIPSRS